MTVICARHTRRLCLCTFFLDSTRAVQSPARRVSQVRRFAASPSTGTTTARSVPTANRGGLEPLSTQPVPGAPAALAASPHAFLEYLRSPTAAPFLLRRPAVGDESMGRAGALLRTLRAAGERVVEVEVGRYDKAAESNRIEAPLGVYLEWLTRGGRGAGEEERLQLYLAQWRARDEVPGLAELVKTPALLEPLLESRAVDLYQTSFFIGPSGMVTPLHYDPYCNLYTMHASSDPFVHAKHFVLLPPTPALSQALARADRSVLRNTSPLELHLRPRPGDPAGSFAVAMDPASAPVHTRDAVRESGAALSCVVREGDTLFVPRRWWHRVENVALRPEVPDAGGDRAAAAARAEVGWTAGVGWWFLPRGPP
ncbi:hypothetical protein BD413DRAFT_466972 [Trametes elegans]|nr:hypothetical protein BD413DRAFT_466972 [Trametes elegans]